VIYRAEFMVVLAAQAMVAPPGRGSRVKGQTGHAV